MWVHVAGMVWLVLCVGLLLVFALRDAGFHWWVIFSLSGHSAVGIFLLTSVYLFAFFRGVDRSQKIEVEHPLTTGDYYAGFYVATPFMGSVAGLLGTTHAETAVQLLLGMALGTLGMTFVVWVIVDPAAGVLELVFPESRRHRSVRLAELRAVRLQRQRQREELLASVLRNEQEQHRRWQEVLEPHAERLAGLLADCRADFARAKCEAVDIGVRAWHATA
jgi:hypothetical protein